MRKIKTRMKAPQLCSVCMCECVSHHRIHSINFSTAHGSSGLPSFMWLWAYILLSYLFHFPRSAFGRLAPMLSPRFVLTRIQVVFNNNIISRWLKINNNKIPYINAMVRWAFEWRVSWSPTNSEMCGNVCAKFFTKQTRFDAHTQPKLTDS